MDDVQYELHERPHGNVLVLRLPLTPVLLDDALATVKGQVKDILDAHACHRAILDLSEATGWNSAALGMLLSIHKHLKEQGGRVSVAGLNEHLTSTYQLCGLDRIMPTHRSVAAALKSDAPEPGNRT